MTTPTPRQLADARYYALLHVSEEDFAQALFCAQHLLKKAWHSEQWERRGTVYHQQAAFTSALVMAYLRPFTETRSGTVLRRNVMKGFSPEQALLHRHLKTLRNSLYAHSDVSARDVQPIAVNGYATAISTFQSMRLSREDVVNLEKMIALVRSSISHEKQRLLPGVSTASYGRP